MKINNRIEKVIGYILLTPALFSLYIFFHYMVEFLLLELPGPFTNKSELIEKIYKILFSNGIIGLMAIAGAYLIKDNKK